MTNHCILWILLSGGALIALERYQPASRLPSVRAWWPRVVFLNLIQLCVVLIAGVTWEAWFARSSLWNLSASFGPAGQGVLAYLVASFVYYWWHRARHAWRPLWLLCHQLHHSPRRIEVATSFYKHPLEALCNAVLSSAIAYLLLGCSPAGAAIYTLLAGAAEFFYHLNVRTPHWLGYLIQRPESHRVHHRRGHHAQNYGDLPVWDMLFGTFHNPEQVEEDCGFDPEREDRLEDMLTFRDVHADAVSAAPPLRFLPRWLGAAGAAGAPRTPRGHNLACLLVLALGSTQLLGALTGSTALRGVGAASAAAPLPKVFTAQRGLETFATEFVIRYRLGSEEVAIPITPASYQRLRGPYNRLNVYGAALSYGPILPPRLRDPVLRHGLSEGGALHELAQIPPGAVDLRVEVRSKTRGKEQAWTLTPSTR